MLLVVHLPQLDEMVLLEAAHGAIETDVTVIVTAGAVWHSLVTVTVWAGLFSVTVMAGAV